MGTPIFFAAACFALLFRDRPEANMAFGWNLLGAVAGGLIEFASMITGIRALYLLVLAAYLGVVLLRVRARRSPAADTRPSGRGDCLSCRPAERASFARVRPCLSLRRLPEFDAVALGIHDPAELESRAFHREGINRGFH